MTGIVKAWQCIGCGKIEAPQTCIGVCQDRKVELVYATQHRDLVTQLAELRERSQALARLVGRLARTTPRDGHWESSYRALQDEARALVAASVS
jgi:hypothetical protein